MTDVVWWEVETADPARFQEFHAALSGWSFRRAFADSDLDADYWVIDSDGRAIGGLQQARPAARAPRAGTRVYVQVDDLEAILARVAELGGIVDRPRLALGGDDRWMATFRDPTGVSFGLWTAQGPRVDASG